MHNAEWPDVHDLKVFRTNNQSRQAMIMALESVIGNSIHSSPKISEVARHLCVSNRTLTRRLQSLGLTYREVFESIKKTRAKEFLLNSSDNISVISKKLGYRDPSNFTKAFKRWTGESPYQYRKNGREKAGESDSKKLERFILSEVA